MKSSAAYLRYVDLDFAPDYRRQVVASYRVARAPRSRLDGLAFLGAVAAESSTGTWTDVSTDSGQSTRVSGRVFAWDESAGLMKVAYPEALFEPGNLSQLLTVVAGNAFGLADVAQLKLLDISIPPALAAAFPGPAVGVDGIYRLLGIGAPRPLLGAILKPKCGLSAEEHAEVSYAAWTGRVSEGGADGVDFVKDDEALTHQPAFGSDFYRRVEATLAKLRAAEDLTGRRKVYVPNVTHSSFREALRRAEFVVKQGGTAAMVDFVIGGGTLLQALREHETGLILHGHRTLFAALHRPADFGVDYRVWAKLFRLVGGDQVHVGTPSLGVMSASASAVQAIVATMLEDTAPVTEPGTLPQSFAGTKAVLPICGAGLDVTTTRPLVEALGGRVLIFAGGGVMGHPDGVAAGAASLRESLQAVQAGCPLDEWARRRGQEYLHSALRYFGSFDKQSPNDGAREHM